MLLAQFNIQDINDKVYSSGDNSVYSCIEKINPATGTLVKECQGSVTPFFVNIINFLLWGVGVAAFLVLLYGAFVYVTAGADPNKSDQAKKIIIGAIIGVVIVAASLVIYNFTIGAINNGASAIK